MFKSARMTWYSIHFYPTDTQDVFLARALKPFLDRNVWTNKEARAFFIRYHDEKGPHIRVRIQGADDWLENTLKPVFMGWFEDWGKWEEIPYEPEIDRFGGEEGILLAEAYFDISSKATLARISRDQFSYGDAMFDALRLHIIAAFSAGFDKARTKWYFEQLFEQWIPLFFPLDAAGVPEEVVAAFDKTFGPQKEKMSATIEALWEALESEALDNKQPEWATWLEGNQQIFKSYGDGLEKALPSLIHLTNNRIGINNQDEVYLNYIISRAI